MKRRGSAVTLILSLAIASGACTSSAPSTIGQNSPSPGLPSPALQLPSPRSVSTPGGSGRGSPGSSDTSPPVATADPTASPAPISWPWESKVPVDAVITPACVRAGGIATITVRTVSQAAVAYHAVYAGTKGGAPPPAGYGYGGNDKGFADTSGRWENSWVVRADAPAGPARADVVVSDGSEFGYDDPSFAVAGPTGRCG